MSGLKGKIILITGASSGIGQGTAQHFASLNCKLALVARNVAKLEEVAAKCRELGAEDVYVSGHDLAVPKECVKAVDNAVSHFGGLDVVVNNAGIMSTAKLETLTEEDYDNTMRVNLKSALLITKHSVKHLEKSSVKSIVNVSSIAGLRAYVGALAYKLSKSGMDQLTRCTALELIPKGIRVNSVNPGVIETELFEKSGMNKKTCKAFFERACKSHPIGRPGRVDEVAKAISFLASEDASFICGQTLAVDGGRSVMCPTLDVLINSAGILVSGDTESTKWGDYDLCMNINTKAAFILTQSSIKHLLKTKGNIVHVSSVTGLRAFPGVLAYNMSKAAVDQLTRTCALELASKGVRVNAVNPGVIITEIHQRAGMNDEKYAEFLEHSKTTHAMGRVGTVNEVAETIAFLASDSASFITGQTLAIDGGRSIMCPR